MTKKIIITIAILSILGISILFSVINTGATTEQAESLKIKRQLEQADKKLLEEKDAAGAEARKNMKDKVEIDASLPIAEPEEFKKPVQWNRSEQHAWRYADTMWAAYGIIAPSQLVWSQIVVWSGHNPENKQAIGTFAEPDFFNGKYTSTYVCPRQDIGKLYITDIKEKKVLFKSDNGNEGTFDLDKLSWDFKK